MNIIEPLEYPRLLSDEEQVAAKLAAAHIVAELDEKYSVDLDGEVLRLRHDGNTTWKWPVTVAFDIPHGLVHVDVESDIVLESGAEAIAWEYYNARKSFKFKHFTLFTLDPGAPLDLRPSWESGQVIHSRFSSLLGAWDTEDLVKLPVGTLATCESDLRRAASAQEGAAQDEDSDDSGGKLGDILQMLHAMNS